MQERNAPRYGILRLCFSYGWRFPSPRRAEQTNDHTYVYIIRETAIEKQK